MSLPNSAPEQSPLRARPRSFAHRRTCDVGLLQTYDSLSADPVDLGTTASRVARPRAASGCQRTASEIGHLLDRAVTASGPAAYFCGAVKSLGLFCDLLATPGSGDFVQSDESRFEAVFREHFDAGLRFALARADSAAAKDAAAETFMAAWQALDRLPPDPRGWLIAVARNKVADHYRAGERRAALISRISEIFPESSADPAATTLELDPGSLSRRRTDWTPSQRSPRPQPPFRARCSRRTVSRPPRPSPRTGRSATFRSRQRRTPGTGQGAIRWFDHEVQLPSSSGPQHVAPHCVRERATRSAANADGLRGARWCSDR